MQYKTASGVYNSREIGGKLLAILGDGVNTLKEISLGVGRPELETTDREALLLEALDARGIALLHEPL